MIKSVNGPYLRKDGRKHVIIRFNDGTRRTMSYPKYLMQIYLGRELLPDETIDHIDRDFRNDSLSNLRVVSRSIHNKEDVRRVVFNTKIFCPMCGKEVIIKCPSHFLANRKQGKVGGFCSKSCVGKYGKQVQMGSSPMSVDTTDYREYYFLNKQGYGGT